MIDGTGRAAGSLRNTRTEQRDAITRLVFEVFGRTDRGLRRDANEDAYLIADLSDGQPLPESAGRTVVRAGVNATLPATHFKLNFS